MEPNKVNLNGSIIEGKGNYIWAGALTLAWQQLTK